MIEYGRMTRGQRFGPQAGVARVGDDADDRDLGRLRRVGQRARGRTLEDTEPQPGANRILTRGPELGGRLVDERDAIAAAGLRQRRTCGRRAGQCHTFADDSAPTRLTASRFDSSGVCPTIVNGDCGLPNGWPIVAASTPGSAANPVQQFLGEPVALVEGRVLGRRQRHAHEQHAIDRESGVHVLQDEERAHGQAGADEQHD